MINFVLSKDNQRSEVLLIKAQILFDQTDFEHSLLYFCRAARISPRSKCARDGISKCYKTIENKLPRTTFRIQKLPKILGELKTLVGVGVENNNHIVTRSLISTHERGNQLHKDYIKVISMEKDFLERTRKQYKTFGSSLSVDKRIISIISESENFLDRRLVFWSQL